MAINRFDRPGQYDWSWQTAIPKLPELNYAALDSIMADTQASIDQNTMLSAQMPKVLNTPEDQALYQSYKTDVDKGLKAVTDAYTTQGLKAGKVAQSQFISQIKDEWSNGRAAVLNDRYTSYNTGLQELDKFRKDDARGINSKFGEFGFKNQLLAPINYNADTKTYNKIGSPELYKDPDIRKAAMEMVKAIEEDGDTEFLKGMDGNRAAGWITKIKTEGKSEGKLRQAMKALLEMPEFTNQVYRDAAVQGWEAGPEKIKRDYENKLTAESQQYDNLYIQSKESKDPAQVREFQNYLSKRGYSVPLNGKFDASTEKAAKELQEEIKSFKQGELDNFDMESFLIGDTKNNYLDYAGGFANQKVDKTLIFDQVWGTNVKIASARANTMAMIASQDRGVPTKADDVSVVNSRPVDLGGFVKTLEDGKKLQSDVYKQAEQIKSGDPMFKGWKNEDIAAAYRTFEDLAKANPGANPNQLKQMYNQKFRGYLDGQGNKGQPGADLFDYVSQGRNAPTIASIDQLWAADEGVNSTASLIKDYGNTYAKTPEGQTNLQRLRGSGFGNGLSDQQLVDDMINNPQKYERTNSIAGGGIPGASIRTGTSKVNYATDFVTDMSKDISKQSTTNPAMYKDIMDNTALLQGNKDEFLYPALDRIGKDISEGAYGSYVSEGQQGLLFYEMPKQGETRKGSEVDPGTFKVDNIAVELDEKGKTVIVYSGTGKNGKSSVSAYTRVTPTIHQLQDLKQGLAGQLTMATESGNWQKQLEIGKKMLGLEDAKWSDYRNFDVAGTKLSYQNTSDEPVYQMKDGKPVQLAGFRLSNAKLDNEFTDGQNVYQTQVVHAWSPYGNQSKTLNIKITTLPNGQQIKVAMPTPQGTLDYGSAANVVISNKNRETIATVPVERNSTKLPEGRYLPVGNVDPAILNIED